MAVKEPVKGAASVGEDVPTAYIPFVPLETKRLPLVNEEEVARPLHEMVGAVPPEEIIGHVPVIPERRQEPLTA